MTRALHRGLPLALLVALLAGCASTSPTATTPAPPPASAVVQAAAPAAAAAAPIPARRPDDIAWVIDSAEYRAACWQAFALARRRVEELTAGRPPGTWAVALDVDETVLSNVQYEVELQALGGKDFDDPTWQRWVSRQEAPPLAGAIPFLDRVRELGGRIALVTNRDESMRADTEANLRQVGVPFDLVLLRPDGGPSAKAPRWEAVKKGTAGGGLPPLEIVLWVGDNIRDFPGLDQSLRQAGDQALAPFGDRYIVVPNPLYGSWRPPAPAAAATPPAAPDAPVYVEEARAMLLKSLPAQLRVAVRGNLPDACTHLGEPVVRREGRTFHLQLTARRDAGRVCAQVLVPFGIEVPVDILGLAAGTYQVEAGGKTDTFTLPRDNN